MKGTAYVIFMAAVAAIGGILFGYDTAVISGTTDIVRNQFSLSASGEGWYVGCALIGSIIGVLCAGSLSDYIGRKITMLISAAFFSISAIGCAICGSFDALVAFRIIGGVGIGIVSIVSPIYISEVSPAKIRGTLVSLYQLAVTAGFLLAYLANWAIDAGIDPSAAADAGLWSRMFNAEAWRGMLGSETLPALLFLFIIFFIPESPKWLIIKGKPNEATAVLSRILGSEDEINAEVEATRSSSGEDKGSWSDLLKPGILVAVLAGCAIAILGQFMGVNAVLYYGPKIFSEAGFDNPMFSTVLVGLVNFATTVLAVFIIDRVGRKQLIYWGVSGMIICLIAIGTYFATGGVLGNGFMLAFFLAYVFCCAISISAIVFVLLSEMYPNSIRGRAMSLAGFMLWVGTYLVGQLTPVLLEWSQAGTFFIFAVMCVPYMLIMWKVIPETTGKTLEEIEEYWTKR
ncbi:MAG: sugar porter family MFS transporter [Bacteroidales bacterium]|nr:sugar porter family MFS transporter [Bacteroidales bacterium]MDY5261880.1 sugar porter family MFS transporter [Candidatus Cryptobacteroides sp.]